MCGAALCRTFRGIPYIFTVVHIFRGINLPFRTLCDSLTLCVQNSVSSGRTASAALKTTSGAKTASDDDMLVVGGKPFYPEVQVNHVETPSKFYVLELCRKESLAE